MSNNKVLTYLRQIIVSLSLLANDDSVPSLPPTSPEDAIALIASLLLQATHPSNLSKDIPPSLIPPPPNQNLDKHSIYQRDANIVKTRLDVLRNILRNLSCVALDIVARISIQFSDHRLKDLEIYCLFAIWLPLAPQCAPFAMDLFSLQEYKCPLDHISTEYIRVVSECTFLLVQFFSKRDDHASMKQWWSWTPLFAFLKYVPPEEDATAMDVDEEPMEDEEDDEEEKSPYDFTITSPSGYAKRDYHPYAAVRWFTVRAISHFFNLTPTSKMAYVKYMQQDQEMVPWVLHPWILLDEETISQDLQCRGLVQFVNDNEYTQLELPSPDEVRNELTLPRNLVHLGQGLLMPCKNTILSNSTATATATMSSSEEEENRIQSSLVMTETTSRNLSLLGTAMASDPYPPPILVCGPRGSGKSSLIRELAQYCSSSSSSSSSTNSHDELLELHVDEETDSKTLLGSYAATDIPGEFTWRPGALTNAVRLGKWVLLEDVESCPAEIQAALVKLLEERVLPLGVNKSEKCHPNFRMFGTCTTPSLSDSFHQGKRRLRKGVASAGSGGKRLLHPGLWRKVHVDPLPYSELQIVSRGLFPNLPEAVSDAALNVLRKLDKSGRSDEVDAEADEDMQDISANEEKKEPSGGFRRNMPLLGNGRHSSVRDLVKLLSRIASNIQFEPGATFCTESQRILCMAESFDIFAGWCPCRDLRKMFVAEILAPIWGITSTAAVRYIEDRQPQIKSQEDYIEVGRCTIRRPRRGSRNVPQNTNFAETNYALRLMESAGVCIAQNEPTLLVGETGCGKTTLIQRLASLSGHELVVQNLSLQTDSTDLLGGYRPLEIRHIARNVYTDFVELFCSSFSKSQNAQFLDYVTTAYEKGQWKRLSQCFQRAAKMGLDKMKQKKDKSTATQASADIWFEFKRTSERFEKQRVACDTGLAFVFTEGALVEAIRTGKWVLLDEINLASSETLERLCGLLDDAKSSVTLTEKGDSEVVSRHPDFRIFAAMNPATDAGKKDLPSSLRSRFTEIYVDELIDPVELRSVAARYLSGVIAPSATPLEHTESVISAVDVYLQCRKLAEQSLVDGGGQRPRYTLRTMCRALSAARNLMLEQKFSVKRALLEGYELGFEGALNTQSKKALRKLLNNTLGKDISPKELDHPGRRPGGRGANGDDFILSKPFWLKTGEIEKLDWSETSSKSKKTRFVLTSSMTKNLRRLSQAVAAGPWPVLLEGPTSAGKTTMVEYLAAKCGHRCVRINNHEHTDVQEYTGSYASDSSGRLCFQEGILVQALRKGHWVILDELNLAPSEVLEALNRLLDDNRELYLAEINEVVKPHPNFRLFATQNPSGAYGGRKPLSRAFRNRFVEMHVGDIPEKEMITILELRCHCPPTHAKLLVKVMSALRKRRSKSGVFQGKDGLITPRDLLRWAERKAITKHDLALNGWMLLAERLRDEDEKQLVKEIIEEHMKVEIKCDELYYGDNAESRQKLAKIAQMEEAAKRVGLSLQAIAPTKSLLRLLVLVERCVEQKEPVLLVGETGCGKTTVVQLMSVLLNRELGIVNCHASTETSDLLGGLRPLRGRKLIMEKIIEKSRDLIAVMSEHEHFASLTFPDYLKFQELNAPENASKSLSTLSKSIRSLLVKTPEDKNGKTKSKRRKLENGEASDVDIENINVADILTSLDEIDSLLQQHASLFEWVDGPLVSSMRNGTLFLLDEMSLAEDAVLERLNSVLEPSRTLTLAEKGGDISDDSASSTEVKAHDDFRVFATMNPGGDFGKRELSPALRSRFTEIWVPSVTDPSDIDLVLGQTLHASLRSFGCTYITPACVDLVKSSMLEYVNWFNGEVCGKPMSTFADFVLSLRDVLAWARFVMETSCKDKDLGIWSSFAHGASLMHLDGLGLGTGLSHEEAMGTKAMAKRFLRSKIPSNNNSVAGFEDEYEYIDDSKLYSERNFGVHPFFIPTGGVNIPNKLGFKLNAPTTGMNLRRVLRAMQISKPILLEGSPGVGKTSLISALAAASGHNLVRINLSEQTDISDLMGSDLPMPEESIDEDGNKSTGGTFKWCDGALLKAIKNGDWVLLDELNLATQSVLEGLNSCLDHRASVFIPELGQTFDCPPTFRIFAAQNPVAQGGGRKGLPKSFLNRFTKVFVEALTKDDLKGIVSAKFPILPSDLVENMVKFNYQVQEDIELRKYGQLGSPWEFNLRDVFRWCDLISNHFKKTGEINHAAFADTIYIQRLRCERDRAQLIERYEASFGNRECVRNDIKFTVGNNDIGIGIAMIERNINVLPPSDSIILGNEGSVHRKLLRPMEAIGLCVEMSWACLLVGSVASGKTTIIKSLAESCNRQLEEIALTPSSDVNELIGTFEQIDAAEVEGRLCKSLKSISTFACLTLGANQSHVDILQHICETHDKLVIKMDELRRVHTTPVVIDNKSAMALASKLIAFAEEASLSSAEFKNICSDSIQSAATDLLTFKRSKKVVTDGNAVHFRWFDGVLVQALENGYWLHLENVNFCPSSVLDRLNPLMEIGGELVLTECGIDEDGMGTSRVIKPHPNFRMFLSMNPAFGEVSRAMRNRCIEVSLLPPFGNDIDSAAAISNNEGDMVASALTLDVLDSTWKAGIRSSYLTKCMIRAHEYENNLSELTDDQQPCRNLHEMAKMTIDLLHRGCSIRSCMKMPIQVAYEVHDDEDQQVHALPSDDIDVRAVEAIGLRSVLEKASSFSKTLADARILKSFLNSEELPLGLTLFQTKMFSEEQNISNTVTSSIIHGDDRLPTIRSTLTTSFFLANIEEDAGKFFEGYYNSLSSVLYQLSNSAASLGKHAVSGELSQVFDQFATFHKLQHLDLEGVDISTLSVIEVSYNLYGNKIDKSEVACPVTPILFPFFNSLEGYFQNVSKLVESWDEELESFWLSFRNAMISRDRLWKFLRRSKFNQYSSFLGFDEKGFLVNWNWFKKNLDRMVSTLMAKHDDVMDGRREIELLIATIDQACYNQGGDARYANSFWKRIGHPIIPAKAENSEALLSLKDTANSHALISDENNGFLRLLSGSSTQIDLKSLFDNRHEGLVYSFDLKSEHLTALAMTYWATTDEMSDSILDKKRDYNVQDVVQMLKRKLSDVKYHFEKKLDACTIDASIKTIDNKLDLEKLEALKEEQSKEGSEDAIQNLLSTFAGVQLTQITEFICVREERWIIEMIASILEEPNDEKVLISLREVLSPRLKNFIAISLKGTIWSIADLRPYQTIDWVLDSLTKTAEPMRYLFKNCFSTLMVTHSKHNWCNSYNDIDSLEEVLCSPPFWSSSSLEVEANVSKKHYYPGLVYFAGAPRINQNVLTEFMFRVQGFKRVTDTGIAFPCLTLENQEARLLQAKQLRTILSSSLDSMKSLQTPFATLKYIIHGIINALRDAFTNEESFKKFYDGVFHGTFNPETDLNKCKHKLFAHLAINILPPLLTAMSKFEDNCSNDDAFFEAMIYVGLIRFHLSIPCSPMDPGQKPGAKVREWDCYLQELGSKFVAIRIENGLETGNFEPNNPSILDLTDAITTAESKRSRQQKKKVERPSNSPPFFDFFKEVHHFAKTIASTDNILGLMKSICNDEEGEDFESNRQKEVNWQSSAVAFQTQVTRKYACYEDVTSPFLAALGIIQDSLRCLIHQKAKQKAPFNKQVMEFQDQLLTYPNVNLGVSFKVDILQDISKSFQYIARGFEETSTIAKMEKNCQLSTLLALLTNICILKKKSLVDNESILKLSSWIFKSLADAWNLSNSGDLLSDPDDETDDEKKEREYREQFPDHAKEFNKIIESVETIEMGGELDDDEEVSETEVNKFIISEEHLRFLSDIHQALFLNENMGDSLRIKNFITAYTAASQINNSLVLVDSIKSETTRLGAHSYALSINTKNDSGALLNFHSFMNSDSCRDIDFHKDPNPTEILKADAPLQGLLIRISQLIRAFPGNSILISIGQIVERLRQMDAKKTSLGKMLTGLEVILKRAQEWEQHASTRVVLGESLQRVSRLVAQWRKLELQSWSSLLNVRDQTHILRAKRHWMRLYNILALDVDSKEYVTEPAVGDATIRFPKWVWMGQASKLHHTNKNKMESVVNDSLSEVIKLLDTFILTSGLGQFDERLRILKTFAHQLKIQGTARGDLELVNKSVILDSLVRHYEYFTTIINESKEILRAPIEKKLKSEVKLAKWDEQSYYALTDSSEKSHRKLMMIVHEYEEVLDMTVARVLEQNFLSGIRSNSEVGPGAQNQPVTEVPSSSSIFPDLQDSSKKKSVKTTSISEFFKVPFLNSKAHTWSVEAEPLRNLDKMITSIPKYSKKMDKLFSSSENCFASDAKEVVDDITESIFERINVLRDKGTKPMKQRALVDLFKLLKKEGYSSMKWSVPKEIREMPALLQIQSPSSETLDSKVATTLESAEKYFRRCTIEISRLRSEVQMVGSQYMSKREMDLMVGFGEHGLLMLCQQRAMIASVIEDINSNISALRVIEKVHDVLPLHQSHLLEHARTFDRQFGVCIETTRQTFLMIKSVSSLVDSNKSTCIDIIGIIEEIHSNLSSIYNSSQKRSLITNEDISVLKSAKAGIEDAIDRVEACTSMNKEANCFSQDSFDQCMHDLRTCLLLAKNFSEYEKRTLEETSDLVTNNVLQKACGIVKSSLLAAQTLNDGFVKPNEEANTETGDSSQRNTSLWQSHSNILVEWDSLNISAFSKNINDMVKLLSTKEHHSSLNIEGICVDTCVLVAKIVDMCQTRLKETLQFYRSIAKFEYVKLRVFRVLIAKGFCADDVEEGGDADGEGGAGDMKFEDDVEGTGMGEGEGKNDVTDQIENEEQLLGLKGDEEKEKQNQDQKQLNEEEAETGMEMENEFDGEMFDVPDKKEDENNDQNDDDEEELDREMGDGSDPNEQVVDEKMWDEDEDDEEDQTNQEEEKFEKDSKMQGEALQDELRTKEEDEGTGEEGKDQDPSKEKSGDDKHDDEAPQNDNDAQDDNDPNEGDNDNIEEDMINNDYEDDYEDQHGVEIRDENEGQEPNEDEDDAMDLNDEMNLDDGEDGEEEEDGEAGGQVGEEDPEGPEDDEDDGKDGDGTHEADPEKEDDDEEMDEDGVENAHQTLGNDNQMNADEDQNENDQNEDNEEEEEQTEELQDMNTAENQEEDTHGVAAKSGTDSVKRQEEEENDENPEEGEGDDEEDDEGAGEGEKDDQTSGAGQSDATSGQIQDGQDGSGSKPSSTAMDAPNPFRDPGDAEKFWHKKLNVVADAQEDADGDDQNDQTNNGQDEKEDNTNPDEDFEFTSKEQDNSTQVLGGVADDEDTTKLNQEDEKQSNSVEENKEDKKAEQEDKSAEPLTKRPTSSKQETESSHEGEDVPSDDEDADTNKDADVEMEDVSGDEASKNDNNDADLEETEDPENKIVTDIEQLHVREDAEEHDYQTSMLVEEEDANPEGTTHEDIEEARQKWSSLQAETNALSRRLCEKLRLVMEPLVASKLRGDYRTGKRINMKRVIGYIASGYRKDKIWLRRTKPGKRDYRVLLAVDNSESMKNGAGDMAMLALSTLANGMSQLEIGELGIASFGEEMKLLHPFHAPFTSASGVDLVSQFKFNDQRTRTALCVESALAALESQSNNGSCASMQLVFIISDGRIERDSREKLRRIVREMTEKNVLVIMVVVEGGNGNNPESSSQSKANTKDSIVHMKEVSFENGKPKVKHFIDDYPFPYYMVLQDMHSLPEVLGDALKQWFEMMSQNQSQG